MRALMFPELCAIGISLKTPYCRSQTFSKIINITFSITKFVFKLYFIKTDGVLKGKFYASIRGILLSEKTRAYIE